MAIVEAWKRVQKKNLILLFSPHNTMVSSRRRFEMTIGLSADEILGMG
jgi:hypothetical protein